ncbi:MAG TPA: hypothetical protein DCS93_42790 [Microscillaceae bacterium]|nr:hypothetical protein [Microscillaceae bacterium]
MENIERNKLHSLGYLSGKVHSLMKKTLTQYLEQAGIPLKVAYYPVISNLWAQDEVTQQTIAEWMGYDRHRVSRIVDDLEEVGLVERKPQPNNLRAKAVCLTTLGKKIQAPVNQAIRQATEQAFTNITEDERTLCVTLLQKIITNLNR